ncbi:uncharacterized protein LOC121915965 [Sceloporus undulatus]|uniref:uncharacterized protein LOC121915965 n=1 Tax=Sceloporus undulatus TaxID=8520 RepID=UPI001C4DA33A|nr:uncharacterized protein LOC121915965 [Sceloporus undulatus]
MLEKIVLSLWFRKRGQMLSDSFMRYTARSYETLESPTENEDEGAPKILPEAGDQMDTSETMAEKQQPSASGSQEPEQGHGDVGAKEQPGANSNRPESSVDREEGARRRDQWVPFPSWPEDSCLHGMCCLFSLRLPTCSFCRERWYIADYVAEKHLDIFIEHVLKSDDRACHVLMSGVLRSSSCNVKAVVRLLMAQIEETPCFLPSELKKQVKAKAMAIRIIGEIVRFLLPRRQRQPKWIKDFHFIMLGVVIQYYFSPEGINIVTYMDPSEIAAIFGSLLVKQGTIPSQLSGRTGVPSSRDCL